ncbi:hypothetical protein CBL_13583 [Carabus blaptoides fortunei]
MDIRQEAGQTDSETQRTSNNVSCDVSRIRLKDKLTRSKGHDKITEMSHISQCNHHTPSTCQDTRCRANKNYGSFHRRYGDMLALRLYFIIDSTPRCENVSI